MTQATIQSNGKTLILTQEPYLDTVHVRVGDTVEAIDGTVYRAGATDQEGNQYQVYWTCLADGEVADWDAFTVIPQEVR